jgi:hypothetical protein
MCTADCRAISPTTRCVAAPRELFPDILYIETVAQTTAANLARHHSLRSRPISRPIRVTAPPPLSDSKVRYLIEYIEENLAGNLTLKTLAAQAQMSPLYLAPCLQGGSRATATSVRVTAALGENEGTPSQHRPARRRRGIIGRVLLAESSLIGLSAMWDSHRRRTVVKDPGR